MCNHIFLSSNLFVIIVNILSFVSWFWYLVYFPTVMQHCILSYLLKCSNYPSLHEPVNKRNKHIKIDLQEVASLLVWMCNLYIHQFIIKIQNVIKDKISIGMFMTQNHCTY